MRKVKLKKDLPEVEIIFCAASEEESKICYQIIGSNDKINQNIKIIPHYWISGNGNKQTDVRDDLLLIIYCNSRSDFNKIYEELKYFVKIRHQYLFSFKEGASTWVNEISNCRLKVFVGFQDYIISRFIFYLSLAIPGVGD